MNPTMTTFITEPPKSTPHRYQLYRQASNGRHYPHGAIIDSPESAVALFLHSAPGFDGGGVQLWEHHDQRRVAEAAWVTETTRMGFPVRHRVNVYHDPALAVVAAQIAERQQIEQSVTNQARLAV